MTTATAIFFYNALYLKMVSEVIAVSYVQAKPVEVSAEKLAVASVATGAITSSLLFMFLK